MITPQQLDILGLPLREARVYLALIELGESTVLPIARKAQVKRANAYDILSNLQSKGLVTFVEKRGRRRYVAVDPAQLGRKLEERVAQFSTLLPELRSIYNRPTLKPKVRYYEGLEGIKQIYRGEIATATQLDAIASPGKIYEHLGAFFDQFARQLVETGLPLRELITRDATQPEQIYVGSFTGARQEWRYLPVGVELETDLVIFDNKLAMISYEGELHGLVIENSAIVRTHRALFNLLWASAK